jgi:hypothetical protein
VSVITLPLGVIEKPVWCDHYSWAHNLSCTQAGTDHHHQRTKARSAPGILLPPTRMRGGCRGAHSPVLHPRGHGSARRDPLRDKIREVGRGLSLADTQTGRFGRLYSRRRLCARRGADTRSILRILFELQQLLRLLVFGRCVPKTYQYRYFANTV